MNRLVIIGNGFDLAHSLPTSYKDFIDDFWKNIKDNCHKEEIRNIVFIGDDHHNLFDFGEPIKNYKDFSTNLKRYSKGYNFYYDKNKHECYTNNSRFHCVFKFENDFFKRININHSLLKWVDIENEYYKELKIIVDIQNGELKKQKLIQLNKEFDQVKKMLENYLIGKVYNDFNFTKTPRKFHYFTRNFEIEYLELKNGRSDYLLEFSKEDYEDLIYFDEEINAGFKGEQVRTYRNTIFLNFNYTNTLDCYLGFLNKNGASFEKFKQIQIHGRYNNIENPINFGFGDEMDEDYKKIENINDNEYLENFKSFQYLQNTNYKNLLDFIDGKKFQVYLMGHSCGLSDRTLLNTVFEHKYCRSIKIFYHQKENGKDNFTDIIQNISRHFNDKKKMREKIVNKSLCNPLPQNIRFSKKEE